MAHDPRTSGTEQPPAKHEETNDDRQLSDAKDGTPTLLRIGATAVAKHVHKRWGRLEDVAKQRLAEIKVNWLRYNGQSFVQVHPSDPNRVFIPPGASAKRAPTINKIKRTVHRYVAQITADEPIMEGVPASHRDVDRDAAESATASLRGEWQRMGLNTELQSVMQFASIMRSAFWFFQWDELGGGEQPAQKFFKDDRGEQILLSVDSAGNAVDNPKDAATIRQGNTKVSVMTPANVRWSGGKYAHDSDEVIVAEIMSLRELYEMSPSTREVKLAELMPKESNKPTSGIEWLEDIRSETPRGMKRDHADEILDKTGQRLEDTSGILDEPVQVMHFFMKPGRTYRKGFHAIVVGDHLIHRGKLRYGMIPIAHFKFLDEVGDPLGLGLVDLLKDPQELLDFVNGQILRYLQMMKRRWFVPMHSGVKSRDLMSPTRSIIEFNPQAGQPIPEVQPEIPNSMVQWVDRFDAEFDDQSGIHDTLQGKHVPGVSSGRHAEALRSGDETLIGLTREQTKLGLEKGAQIMLAIQQKEWKMERRVRFLGADRQYVDDAFMSADFGDTAQVILKNSTLLMLTPAQRLDTIMSFAEAGALSVEEIRRLAPLGDVMGISLSEDVHYQRARRQGVRFLKGPPTKLTKARTEYEAALEALATQAAQVDRHIALGGEPTAAQVALTEIEQSMSAVEAAWQAEVDIYAFDHRPWEDRQDIARIHAQVHADALAADKVDRFPEWWVDLFEAHTTLEWQLGFPEQILQQAQVEQASQPQPSPGITGEPAGQSFGEEVPPVISGTAP